MKRIYFFLTVVILSSSVNIYAGNDKAVITHGPWLCDMCDDAVTIVWTTDKPALAWAEVCEDNGEHFYAREHKQYYDARFGRRRALETIHSVRVTGLKPGTKYNYRIFSRVTEGWDYSDYVKLGDITASSVYKTAPYSFTTFSRDKDSIRFLVVNDIHGRSEYLKKLCSDVDFSKYDFVVLNGDMLSMMENAEQMFSGWLDCCVGMFASCVPVVFVRGNHENRGRYADSLFEYFPTSCGRFYYSFEDGGTDFLVLDCGEDKPDSDIEYGGIAEFDSYREEQADWLSELLSDRMSARRIVFLHIPPGTSTWHGDKELQRLFLPLLQSSGTDLMISGHTHRYMFLEPDASHDYPILVNDNNSYLDVTVSQGGINARVVGEKGRIIHKHNFKETK